MVNELSAEADGAPVLLERLRDHQRTMQAALAGRGRTNKNA